MIKKLAVSLALSISARACAPVRQLSRHTQPAPMRPVYLLSYIACVAALPSLPPLPILQWEQRSDWLNVLSFGAKGDGQSDDTLAIQSALNLFSNTVTQNTTLYFPAGTFLVTQTLVLNRTLGVMLLGSGELTRLKWGGARGDNTSRLLHSDGNTRFHIEGFIFDGSGSCYVGMDHDSKNQYESRVVHQNLAFINFMEAGLRVGHAQFVASAEMTYINCVFAFNAAGVAFMQWNVSSFFFQPLGSSDPVLLALNI